MSVVTDYYQLKKFNVYELANENQKTSNRLKREAPIDDDASVSVSVKKERSENGA
jgi:hypothetical protein